MPRKKRSKAVRRSETTIDPRQPSLLEKNRNIPASRHALCLRVARGDPPARIR
jgi:hypothetical protein